MVPAGDERTPDGAGAAPTRPPNEQLMSVHTAERGDAVVITVEGAVDALTEPRLRTALRHAFEHLDGRILILDLTAVEFFGSPGLRMLSESAQEAVHHRGQQTLRVVIDHTRPVIRPIEIVGLDGVLALYHDVESALAHDPIN